MIIIGLLVFIILILIHEWGHFMVARRNGVKVEEFGLGFPPRLAAKKHKQTIYSLNLIPLGGFVRLKGESSEDKRPHSFGAAAFSKKAKILLAGVAMNVVGAFVLLLILAWVGMPKIIDGQFTISADEHVSKDTITVASVVDDSAAQKAGLKPGDNLLAINGESIQTVPQLIDLTKAKPSQKVAVTWRSQDEIKNQTVTLGKSDSGTGQLGIVPYQEQVIRYSWAAPLVALGLSVQLIWLTVLGLAQIIAGLISEGASSEAVAGAVGPVGVFALLSNAGQFGAAYVVVLMVVISISLAVINALPIPALDGGRLALISLFRVLKKPLTERLESLIHGIGFVALLLLAIFISYFDIVRFF